MPLLQITAAPPPASGCCLLGPMGDSGNSSKRGRQRQPPGASAGSEAAAEAPGQDRRPQRERPNPPGSAKGGRGKARAERQAGKPEGGPIAYTNQNMASKLHCANPLPAAVTSIVHCRMANTDHACCTSTHGYYHPCKCCLARMATTSHVRYTSTHGDYHPCKCQSQPKDLSGHNQPAEKP